MSLSPLIEPSNMITSLPMKLVKLWSSTIAKFLFSSSHPLHQNTCDSVCYPSVQLDSNGLYLSCICNTCIWKSGTLFLERPSLEYGSHGMECRENAPRIRLGPQLLVAGENLVCWFLLHAGHRVFAHGVAQPVLILVHHWHSDFV